MKNKILVILFFIASLNGFAQNVSGNWQGILTHPQDTIGFSDNFAFWLNIEQEGDSIFGFSRIELGNTKNFSVMHFKGSFKNQHLEVVENAWEESHMAEGVFINWCLKRMSFIYHWEDSTETLRGVWSSNKDCGPGEIFLHRSAKEFSKVTPQSTDYVTFKEFKQRVAVGQDVKAIKVILPQVTFEADQSKLLPDSRPILKDLKDVMIANPGLQINILGHTGNIGLDQYNMTLSLQRAKTVKDFLEKLGVPESRIHYQGFGEARPVADNTSEEGRKKNRRIEFEIIGQ